MLIQNQLIIASSLVGKTKMSTDENKNYNIIIKFSYIFVFLILYYNSRISRDYIYSY